MWKKIKNWFFPKPVEQFKFDAVDRDGDGIVQEGSPFERKVVVVKKAAKKSPPKKKAPVKKAPVKKPVKKNTKKK